MSRDNKQDALVPKLRFSEFRDAPGWETRSGDQLFDSISNRASVDGLPVLAVTQEHGAVPRDEIDYHVSVSSKSIENYKEVCPGDFIISLRSFQGGIEYSSYHGICSPAYVILRQSFDGSSDFYRHYFKSERFIRQLTRNLEGLRDGKMISYRQFSEQDLLFPASRERQRIADCLGSLDDLITAEGRKLDVLRYHKTGLMQQLFPREGETQPRLRFPEFQDTAPWEPKTIDSVATLKNGYAFKSSTYVENGDFRIVTIGNVQEGRLDLESTRSIASLPEDIQDHQKLNPGDILVSMTGNVGRVCIVSDTGLLLNQRVGKLVPQHIDHGFFFQMLNRQEFRSAMQLAAAGGAQGNVSAGGIRAFGFGCPVNKNEQKCIAVCLSALDTRIAAQAEKLDALRTHKRGLMQQLFPYADDVPGGRI